MTRILPSVRSRQFGFLVLLVIVLGIIGGVVFGTARRARLTEPEIQTSPPVVLSVTPSIRVVSATRQPIGEQTLLNVSIQNLSSKNIKAYVISGGKAWYTKSYLFEDTFIGPNALDNSVIPGNGLISNQTTKDLAITGVLFDDGSVDGQTTSTLRLIQNYRGVTDQAKRLMPCLQQLSTAPLVKQESAFSKCDADVANLPLKEGSADYQEGLRNTQLMFSNGLSEIKQMLRDNRSEDAMLKKQSIISVFQSLSQSAQ
jgi:hypothetical protein